MPLTDSRMPSSPQLVPRRIRGRCRPGDSKSVHREARCASGAARRIRRRACLDFLRMLRAVELSQNQVWDLFSLLDVIDERSVGRLLDRGGLRHFLGHTSAPSVEEFLATQRFIERTDVLLAVAKRLAANGTKNTSPA